MTTLSAVESLDLAPDTPSDGLFALVAQIERGRMHCDCSDSAGYLNAAHRFGITLWEYSNVICPLLNGSRYSYQPDELYEQLDDSWLELSQKLLELPLGTAR